MKPLNHKRDYMRLVVDQLRAEFPHASGNLIKAAAAARVPREPYYQGFDGQRAYTDRDLNQ